MQVYSLLTETMEETKQVSESINKFWNHVREKNTPRLVQFIAYKFYVRYCLEMGELTESQQTFDKESLMMREELHRHLDMRSWKFR